MEQALRDAGLPSFEVDNREIVGPVIGADLQRRGIYAVLTSLAAITIYIGVRFRFSFAVGAIAATLHDVLVTLAFLMFFRYDISLNVVAAILTITGYSVNDTIVIFDRVRENLRSRRREPLGQIVNHSVNQTLGRTVITASLTFLSVLALYLFGGEALEGFAFTMLVGVISGTYSTVFIASAIAIILSQQRGGRPRRPRRRPERRPRVRAASRAAHARRSRIVFSRPGYAAGRLFNAACRRVLEQDPLMTLLPTAYCQLLFHVTYLQAAILGIVQGLTEFLPISSTAHLLIGGRLLGHDDPGGVFTVMIQLGAILAVMWLYRERIIAVVSGLFSRPEARRFAVMLLVAFLPAVDRGAVARRFRGVRPLREPDRVRVGVHPRRAS